MAKEIICGVAQTIIENLGSQIFQEIGKLYGVEKEIEKLRGTVSRIQSVLDDAKEQQLHNHQVKKWIEKLEAAVLEANELLKEYGDEYPEKSGEDAVENITGNSGEETQQQNTGENSGEETQQQNAGENITEESGEETQQQNAGENITENGGEVSQQQNAGGNDTKKSGDSLQKAGKKITKEVCKFFSNSNQIAFYTKKKKKNKLLFILI